MKATSKTRVQRRTEKKQTAMLVLLVVVISIVSFALGVVVGRNSNDSPVVQLDSASQRISVAEVPATSSGQEKIEPRVPEEKLSFYENLSKDEPAPIGSGINLPPDTDVPVDEKMKAEQLSSKADERMSPEISGAAALTDVQSSAVAQVKVSAELQSGTLAETRAKVSVIEGAQVPGPMPKVAKDGAWVVQVFSSRSAADAGTLRDGLSGKGYTAFIAEADLGNKGIWYRVYLGPYAEKTFAEQVQLYAGKKDKLKGFVKRR